MRPFLLFLLITLSTNSSIAQGTKRLFRVIISTVQDEKIAGYLYDVNDSTIAFVDETVATTHVLERGVGHLKVHRIPIADINRLTIYRRGHVGRGAVSMAVPGMIGGITVLKAHQQRRNDGVNSAGGLGHSLATFILTPLYMGIGAIVCCIIGGGTVGLIPRMQVKINGDSTAYHVFQERLQGFAYKHQLK